MRRIAILAALVCSIAVAVGPASAGAAPDSDAVLSPLALEVTEPPEPVLAADGLNHLAYEILIFNQSPAEVTLGSVQAKTRGKPIGARLEGAGLAAALRRNSGGPGATLGPGESALLFMDVTYPRRADPPRRLKHRIELSIENASDSSQPIGFSGVPTEVGQVEAIELDPPLRGPRWLAANGCCRSITSHRGATLAIDGTLHAPERFAIDFVQLDSENRLFSGPADELSSYAFYGAPIHSAGAGKVVRVQDGLPEQVPGALPAGASVQNAGGNYIVVRLDRDRYAFYAHLQRGTARVERGDRVQAGEILGLLGNSGNTDGPHLHFHVMDSPSPLQSNGLPFTFSRFSGAGVVADAEALFTGASAQVEPRLLGPRRHRMPLENQLIDFGA